MKKFGKLGSWVFKVGKPFNHARALMQEMTHII